jgi:hypothetical protein
MAQFDEQVRLPFSCRWVSRIVNGNVRINDDAYAVCLRVTGASRVVSREECARCEYWDVPALTRRIGAFR